MEQYTDSIRETLIASRKLHFVERDSSDDKKKKQGDCHEQTTSA